MGSTVKRPNRPARRPPIADLAPTQRSAVTNGRLFAGVIRDGRSGWSRRLQDLISLYIADLGGEDVVSDAERSLVRRIATISVELEWIEQSFALSDKGPSAAELDMYLRGSNSLRRHFEAIGIKRATAMRDITPPSLADIRREMDARRVNIEEADG